MIFSGLQRNLIQIKGLEKYSKYIFPPLLNSPKISGKKQTIILINQILEEIGDYKGDQCIIESGYFPLSLWAELVAQRLKCRHLVFLLQEKFRHDKRMIDFLRFKYDRHELAGIVKDSICKMLNDSDIEKRENTIIRAYHYNIFEDCIDNYSKYLDPTADYTFASLGRLIKPCVPALIEAFCCYADHHRNKRFNIVMIGGSKYRGKEKEILNKTRKHKNINTILTGDLYPIPISLIKNVDVFVSTAGSAVATYRACRPTIMVHPITGLPIGTIGLDFMLGEKSSSDSTTMVTIEDCINKTIQNCDKIVYSGVYDANYNNKMNAEFERQLSFVNSTETDEYYDETQLMSMRTPHLHYPYLHRMVETIFGVKGYQCVLSLLGKGL